MNSSCPGLLIPSRFSRPCTPLTFVFGQVSQDRANAGNGTTRCGERQTGNHSVSSFEDIRAAAGMPHCPPPAQSFSCTLSVSGQHRRFVSAVPRVRPARAGSEVGVVQTCESGHGFRDRCTTAGVGDSFLNNAETCGFIHGGHDDAVICRITPGWIPDGHLDPARGIHVRGRRVPGRPAGALTGV